MHAIQSGQGVNQAIEDAGALGILFRNVTQLADIDKRLKEFEAIRLRRAGAIQVLARINRGSEASSWGYLKRWANVAERIDTPLKRDDFIYGLVSLNFRSKKSDIVIPLLKH